MVRGRKGKPGFLDWPEKGILSFPGGQEGAGLPIYQLPAPQGDSRNICNQHSKGRNLPHLHSPNPPAALRGVCDYPPFYRQRNGGPERRSMTHLRWHSQPPCPPALLRSQFPLIPFGGRFSLIHREVREKEQVSPWSDLWALDPGGALGSPLRDARGPCQGQCSGLQALPTAGEQGCMGLWLRLCLPTPGANSS